METAQRARKAPFTWWDMTGPVDEGVIRDHDDPSDTPVRRVRLPRARERNGLDPVHAARDSSAARRERTPPVDPQAQAGTGQVQTQEERKPMSLRSRCPARTHEAAE
jgi:hypothetical protein